MARHLLIFHPMRLAPLLLLAIAPAAFAQGTLTVQFQDDDLLTVNATLCDSTINVDWTATSGGASTCTDLRLWVTDRTTCGDAPQSGDLDLGTASASDFSAGSGRKSFLLDDLPGIEGVADAGSGCGAVGFEQTFIGCGRFTLGSLVSACSSPTVVTNSTLPKLVYDALPPSAPTLDSLIPLDGALLARVSTTGADAVTVVLFVKEAAAAETAYTAATTFSTEAGSGKITGLQNGVAYSVKAYAEDVVANRSEASSELTGTPENSEGFFGNYRRLGGDEVGGCSAVGGGSMVSALALLVLGAAFLRRRW